MDENDRALQHEMRAAGVAPLTMIDDVRSTARLVALGLMLCVAIGPVVLDVCALSCEASADQGVESAPACHHGSATSAVGTHLKSSPAPCGHDHHLLAATTTAPSRDAGDAHRVTAVGLLATASSLCTAQSATSRVLPRARSHCPQPDTLRLTPLRV
jgi:hypothetical protein